MPQPAPRVLILQPLASDGPAFLASWLREAGVAFDVCSVEAGDPVPVAARAYSAVAMLGGTMSVNDDLPFLRSAEALLRDAIALERPVLGHCLGGQLLARVLGAATTDNPSPEIGWARIRRADRPLARDWLGEAGELAVFEWHHQTFGLPAGAELLAGNAACAHQAFGYGPHLGMQFHIEVDADKLARWIPEAPAPGDPLLDWPGVHDSPRMAADTAVLLAASQRSAAAIYGRWLALAGRAPAAA